MDNRQLIMEKALELFCARGYDAVGVQEIAEQSGITKPTLYYYFGSKQGLMETILEENSRILEEMLEKAVEEPGDVPQVLYRVARAYFDFAGSQELKWMKSDEISPRQLEMLRLYIKGYSYSEIGKQMNCSAAGVRWNFQDMIAKAGYSCKEELLAAVLESKLVVSTLKDWQTL